jgi:hypothetical protein
MVDAVEARIDSVVEAERTRTAAETERARLAAQLTTAESFNQIVRRLRQAEDGEAVLELAAEAASIYAGRVVVLAIEKNQARAVALRGVRHEGNLTIEVSGAAAIRSVLDTKDPVTALGTDSEISAAMAAMLGSPEGKVYLFPLMVRQDVRAVLVAAGDPKPAPLELIAGMAGLRLEVLAPEVPDIRPLPSPQLVQIETPKQNSWNDLSPEDQKLHLQAQRLARVKVAEMRLYRAEQLREGAAAGGIYNALRTEIDSARTAFLQNFLSKSPTMVDYLHLEILRSLAHDDDRLLGEDYPGPMV